MTHGEPCDDTWQAMCVCMAHIEGYKYGHQIQFQDSSVHGSSKEKKEEGKREREERKEGGKEKKMKEEKRRRKGRKRGKRKRKRKECCAVSKPGRQRSRNCATRGRFPHTLVILRLGVV